MYHTNLSLAMQCLSSAIENGKNIRIKIIFFLRNEKDKKKRHYFGLFFLFNFFFLNAMYFCHFEDGVTEWDIATLIVDELGTLIKL
jgi:hypothetical protein